MDRKLRVLTGDTKEVLQFLKSRYHFIHLSNVFFRDFQYGIIAYFESKGVMVTYREAEEVAGAFVSALEQASILKAITANSWMLNYPEFKKLPTKPSASAKPAAASAPRAAAPGGAKQRTQEEHNSPTSAGEASAAQ